MRYLFIAEKPSVMEAVKETYRNHKDEINGKVGEMDFTALSGHVCRFLEPDEYPKWKGLKWREIDFPMVPEDFKVSYIKGKEKKIDTIKGLLKNNRYDGIIVGTDSDTEGNGIYWLLREYLGLHGYKTLRYFESSLTDKEILDSLCSMTDFDKNPRDVRMTEGFLLRAKSDWLIGMNATRAVTVKCGELMRIGRVKAPTLKLVYDNSAAIDSFVPHSDYLVKATYADGFSGIYCENGEPVEFEEREKADRFVESLSGEVTGTVTDVQRKNVKTPAPRLYKLSTIQKDAGTYYGFSPQQTQDMIQSLYEKKLVSYPRTNGEYVSSQKALEFPELLNTVMRVPGLKEYVKGITQKDIKNVQKNRRVVNDDEVKKESHDALLPTSKAPDTSTLNENEKKIYDLICRRFTAQFMPQLEEEKTAVTAEIGGRAFRSNGTRMLEKGWSALYNRQEKGEYIPSNVRKGSDLLIESLGTHEKKSAPPKRLTASSLIDAMEHIGKYVDDKGLKSVMDGAKGIGQPSTRGKIIEELIKTGYMESKGKGNQLYITDCGKRYINSLKGLSIADPVQSAEWESLFAGVREGRLEYGEAERQILGYVEGFVKEVRGSGMKKAEPEGSVMESIKCPWCGGSIKKLRRGYACEHSKDKSCGFRVPNPNGKLTDTEFKKLIKKGETKTIKAIAKSARTGREFDAALVLNPKGSEYATSYKFPERAG